MIRTSNIGLGNIDFELRKKNGFGKLLTIEIVMAEKHTSRPEKNI